MWCAPVSIYSRYPIARREIGFQHQPIDCDKSHPVISMKETHQPQWGIPFTCTLCLWILQHGWEQNRGAQIWKPRRRHLSAAFKDSPVNSTVQFVRGRGEHVFTRHEKQGCLRYFTVFSKIQREQCCIAGGWGCYAMVFIYSISDGSEGNTTPSVHTGRPSVSAVSDSLKNIWLTCRPRSF